MYNKFKQFFNVIGTFLLVSLIPILALAEKSAIDNIAKQYNSNILNAIGDQFLTTPFLQWHGPLISSLFGICFIIALSQAFSMQGSAQFMRLLDLAVYGFIALALLGQPTAYQATKGLFVVSNPVKYPGSGVSLDRDIFNWTAETADNMADVFFGENLTERLINASYQTSVFVNGLIEAKTSCTDANIGCMKKYIDPDMQLTAAEQKAKADLEAENLKKYSGWNQIGQLVALIFNFIAKIYDPFAWFFPLLLWVFDIIRSAVNMFVLVGFGIITAFALFMSKLFIPFIILPGYRQQIYKGFRFVLSVTLFGFVTSLIIFMSIAITTAMTQAGRDTFLSSIASNQGIKMSDMLTVLTSLFIGQLVIAAIQIVALIKVPKIAENIVNLSMDSVVGLGTELVSAAGGLARGIAGIAAMAAGVPLAGMATSLGSAAKGAGGAITQGLSNKFPGIRKSMPGFDQLTGKSGGGSGGGSEFGTSSLSSAARDMAAKESTQSASRSSGASFSQDDAIRKVKTPAGVGSTPGQNPEEKSTGSKILEVGKKVAGEAVNLGIDSVWAGTTGNVPDVSRVIDKGLVGGSAMLKQARENYTSPENQSRIQETTRAATARTLNKMGITTTSGAERNAANQSLNELTNLQQLTGEKFNEFSRIQEKTSSGEALDTTDVSKLMEISQSSELSNDQKLYASKIMEEQYNQAIKDKDYEQMFKIANSNLGEGLQSKNANLEKLDKEYSQYASNVRSQIAKAVDAFKNDPQVNGENSKQATDKIIQMTKEGFLSSKSLMAQAGDSIRKVNEHRSQGEMEQLNSYLNKFNSKQKLDNLDEYNQLLNIVEKQKHKITDEGQQKAINKVLEDINTNVDFTPFELNKDTEYMADLDAKAMTVDNKINIGNETFIFSSKGEFDNSGFLRDGKEYDNFRRVSKDTTNQIEEKIEFLENYLNKFSEMKQKNPNISFNQEKMNNIQQSYSQLKAILKAIKGK